MSERTLAVIFVKDREIHGESGVWSTALRLKESCGLIAGFGFECNSRSVGMVLCEGERMVMS